MSAPKKEDFDRLKPEMRAVLVRDLVVDLLGEAKGGQVAEQLEPGIRSRARQPGDAREPERNHWKGAWRIYELEGPGDPSA